MKKVFKRPGILKDVPFHYCPGCTHGVAHRLVAEVIEELGIRDTAIGVAPVGCSVFAMDYFENPSPSSWTSKALLMNFLAWIIAFGVWTATRAR
jgi:pyruvate/2-oxoacid:ferredoxin oxidoreductase beta subunit